jgi:hypothetical protein
MPEPQVYEDIWIRWVHSTWENASGWRTDIRPNILNDTTLKKVLFILDDSSCVFILMDDLRSLLSQRPRRANDCITFNVNPSSKTVNESRIKMAEESREFIKMLEGLKL